MTATTTEIIPPAEIIAIRITGLEDQISELQAQLSAKTGKVDRLRHQISTCEAREEELSAEAENLDRELTVIGKAMIADGITPSEADRRARVMIKSIKRAKLLIDLHQRARSDLEGKLTHLTTAAPGMPTPAARIQKRIEPLVQSAQLWRLLQKHEQAPSNTTDHAFLKECFRMTPDQEERDSLNEIFSDINRLQGRRWATGTFVGRTPPSLQPPKC